MNFDALWNGEIVKGSHTLSESIQTEYLTK